MNTAGIAPSERNLFTRNPARVRLELTRCIALVGLMAAALTCALPVSGAPLDVGGKKSFACYQGNAYIGAFYEGILAVNPTNITDVIKAVTEIYMQVLASDPPARMAALADEIVAAHPDIAGLEELWSVQKAPATLQGPGEFTVVHDYLQLLTTALAAKGAHYQVVVVASEQDITMPMLDLATGDVVYARVVDREAILVRTDLPPGYLRVTNPMTGRYTAQLEFPSFGITVPRGWCSVDTFVRGERFHFICTHLEDENSPAIQEAQGAELVANLANVTMPIVIVGDFNADPLHRNGTTTYDTLVAGGFQEAWGTLNPSNPAGGLTWGHDATLADPTTSFQWRIDYVWYRGEILTPTAAEIMDPRLDQAVPPMWPSDHAALCASFFLGNPKASISKAAVRIH